MNTIENSDSENKTLKSVSENKYELAFKRMKRLKQFYKHLFIFLLVNASIILGKYFGGENSENIFWRWQTFSTAFFWGLGLLAHGLSVFGKEMFFGDGWEERKIQELIEKDNVEKWE